MIALAVKAMSISDVLIAVVVIVAAVALVYVALRQFGVGIPDWVVIVAFVVVLALRFLFSL